MAKEIILPFSELKGTLVDTPNEPTTLEITENGVYNVKGYVYADVNVEGGGGSSDFSTAEVTFINNEDHTIPIPNIPVIQNNVLTAVRPNIDTQLILTIPLYKGKLVLFEFGDRSDNGIWSDQDVFITTGITNITGNCQNTLDWDNCNGSFLITGDCVITITDYSK